MTGMPQPRAKPTITATPQENQRAASHPAASVWVNASAGSGKTTVLTARVTRLLLAGVAPEKILCLTYTRAGAAEMTNRITAQFSRWVSCDEDSLRADLDRLQDEAPDEHQPTEARRLFARILSCPGGLRIRTIHSFCQEILSRFPIEAGLPPHFALIEEQELDRLKDQLLDDLLREAATTPDTELSQALAVLIAEQGEQDFTKMLQEALRECGRLTEPAATLVKRTRDFLSLAPEETPQSFRAAAMRDIPEPMMRDVAKWLCEGTPSHQARSRLLAAILDMQPAARAAHFNSYRGLFLTRDNDIIKNLASKNIIDKYPDITAHSMREATRLQSILERIESAGIAQLTASVLTFGSALSHKLAAAKRARAALDYDDLIAHTENLLRRKGIAPWILYKLDNGIDHILVDEAQDTSRAQWHIVQDLTQEFYAGRGAQEDKQRTLFVVGDEKQSIFSFQNADPEAFLSLRTYFAQKLSDADKTLERIGLHTSFRSAPAILRAVDAIFAEDTTRRGVSQEPVLHTAHKNRDGSDKIGRVEMWPLLKPLKDNGPDDGDWVIPTGYDSEQDSQAELAQQIAATIKGWLTHHETLPGTAAAIRPGDIMILLRRRGRFADLMVRALKTHNVPVTGIDRMHLIKQLPVMDLLALIRFVLLPEDDLNLAILLRSPLIGLGEDDLMTLAARRTGSLWDSLKTHATKESQRAAKNAPAPRGRGEGGGGAPSGATSIITPHYPMIYAYLTARLNEADFTTPFAFLSTTLNMPCPADSISGRRALWARLGGESLDPIDELLNEAQNFAHTHGPSLQNFLHWLTLSDREIKRELDKGDAHGAGQVRIMTVHASKGLEAPIVFLPDTAAIPRSTDIPKFQWNDPGTPLFLTRTPLSGAARDLWQAARNRQMEEYRRLFYVALTRAANHLVICGWQSRNDGADSWYNLAAAALRPLHQPEAQGDSPHADIVIADPIVAAATAQNPSVMSAPPQPLPAWALRPASQQESSPPPRGEGQEGGLSPRGNRDLTTATSPQISESDNTAAATPDLAFARGRIIHRLLQSLPDIVPDKRAAAIDRFLSQPRHNLSTEQQNEIAQEVTALLANENFAALFGNDSRAEVALTGLLNGAASFRQIDRLCLRGDEIWIVDYKTNRPPPTDPAAIPDSYRRQLTEYRDLLGGIYPERKIRCFLLWTYAPRLMEVSI